MNKDIFDQYKQKEKEIRSRLESFKNLDEKNYFNEFIFCLLTPQSNAQRCWEAVEQLSVLNEFIPEKVTSILSKKTRFHNTKTKRILAAKETFNKILPLLNNQNKLALRNQIAEKVNGYGLKESSHFLRNIGHSNNQIAILDRHILRNLKELNLIKEDKIKSKKAYLETEKIFIDYANSINIPPDELDLLFWSNENGEIFK